MRTVASLIEVHIVMGDNFISPEEVETVYEFKYDQLGNPPFSEYLIGKYSKSHILIPAPPHHSPLNFTFSPIGWLEDSLKTESLKKDSSLIIQEKVPSNDSSDEWYLLRKDSYPGSLSPWNQQVDLIGDSERIPRASELLYIFLTVLKVRGDGWVFGNGWLDLLTNDVYKRTRTSTRIYDDKHVEFSIRFRFRDTYPHIWLGIVEDTSHVCTTSLETPCFVYRH